MSAQVFQILVTTLLTIVIGLNAWQLKTMLRQDKELTQLSQQIWGRDGRNGHASEIAGLRKSFNRIERYLTQMGFRMQRVEEKLGLDSGEHPRIRERRDAADDTEDDARGRDER